MFTLDTLAPLPDPQTYPGEVLEPVDFDLADDDRALCPWGCGGREACRCTRSGVWITRAERLAEERRARVPQPGSREWRNDWDCEN